MTDAMTALTVASEGQRGLATRAQLAAAGLGRGSLARALETKDLVRIHRAVYGREPLAPHADHLLTDRGVDAAFLRSVQAALLASGDSAVATRRTAAVIWGLDMLVEPDVLDIGTPRSRGAVALEGVRVRRREGTPSCLVHGLGVSPLYETLRDCAGALPEVEAVAILDSALRTRRTSMEAIGRATSRGSRLHRALQLADPRSESVLESALRVLLIQHGLAPPEAQYVIRAGGRFVARVDFCWPALRLIVEADGRRWHDPADRRNADRRRANACAAHGWRVLRFTWAEVLHNPDYVVATVRAALRPAA